MYLRLPVGVIPVVLQMIGGVVMQGTASWWPVARQAIFATFPAATNRRIFKKGGNDKS